MSSNFTVVSILIVFVLMVTAFTDVSLLSYLVPAILACGLACQVASMVLPSEAAKSR